jgi:hypothetical protein
MRDLYVEGVAIHGDPESCVGDLRGRSEALTGAVQAGLLSRKIGTARLMKKKICAEDVPAQDVGNPRAGGGASDDQRR